LENIVTFSEDRLKELIKESVKECIIEILTQRRDLIEDTYFERLEDIGLAKAINEGLKSKKINKKSFVRKIHQASA